MNNKSKENILNHLKDFPLCEITDLIKLIYQNEVGPKHIAENEIECFKNLSEEIKNISFSKDEPLFTDIGENSLRLNLRALPVNTDLRLINKIIMLSAECYPEVSEKLVVPLGFLVVMAENNEIPYPIQDVRDATHQFALSKFKPVSHSDSYRNAYNPSYRVIHKKYKALCETVIALSKIDSDKKHIVISIDGNAASGKTTLSQQLAFLLGAEEVHCDDFFLPVEMRTCERLNETGGNIHYERLKTEVIDKLKKPSVIAYKKYDCQKDRLTETKVLMNKKYVIVEGAYSSHPYFKDYADLKIFLSIDAQTQKERILFRNGEKMYEKFQNIWIPMENKYFKNFKIKENSDIIIRMVKK